ncbi:MAG: hypothetical protein ABIN13_09140 [Mucilaginibacter sp.]
MLFHKIFSSTFGIGYIKGGGTIAAMFLLRLLVPGVDGQRTSSPAAFVKYYYCNNIVRCLVVGRC